MGRKIFIGLAAAALLLFVLGLVKYRQISSAMAEGQSGPPPQAVTSFKAISEKWPQILFAVGSLNPVQGAMLSAEEWGRVQAIHFESGADVKKGDILVEFDADVERGQLEAIRAQLELANITLRRQRALMAKNATSQSALDGAQSNVRSLKAEVGRLEAIIEQKKVLAPFDGRTGIRQVNLGQTIDRGTPVVELSTVDPLHVDFALPQKAARFIEVGLKVEVEVDAFPDRIFEGEVSAIGAMVDSLTRNIAVQATLPNPNAELYPGMFADVRVVLPVEKSVVTIPASSVSYAPYGNSVYLIGEGPEGAPRPTTPQVVIVGERRGDRIAVESGLQPGDEIVSSGTFKLFPGAQVVVNNVVQPKNELNPMPADT